VGNAVQILNAGANDAAGRAAAQADNGGARLAPQRRSGRAGRNDTWRRNVGQVRANCAATSCTAGFHGSHVFWGAKRYGTDRQPALYKESRIWYSCCPVNQWVMHKDAPGEPSMRYGKLLTG